MRLVRRALPLSAAVLAGLLATAAAAQAPSGRMTGVKRWSMDARAGLVWPSGTVSQVERMGGGAGFGVGYRVLPRVGVRVEADVDFLLGQEAPYPGLLTSKAPSMTLWSLGAGPVFWLTSPVRGLVSVRVAVLGGATILDTDDTGAFLMPDGSRDFTHTYPGLDGSAWVGLRASPHVTLFLTGAARGVFTSRSDTGIFSRLSSRIDPSGFSSVWVFPLQGGVRIRF